MDFRGRLLYSSTIDDVYYMYYVVCSYTLFTTSVKDLIKQMYGGDTPPLYKIWEAILTDAITGMMKGHLPSVQAVIEKIPLDIGSGVQIPYKSYVAGGSEQYFTAPTDIHLMGADANLRSFVAIVSDPLNLEIVGLEGMSCWYKHIVEPPVEAEFPFPTYTSKDIGGGYSIYVPSEGSWQGASVTTDNVARWQDVMSPGDSYMMLDYSDVLVPVNPPGTGSYFHPDATLQLSGGISASGLCRYYASDAGYDMSVPFSATEPPASRLESNNLLRIYQATDYVIKFNYDSSGGAGWVVPGIGGHIRKRPKGFLPGRRISVSPVVVALALLRLVGRGES